MRWEKAPIDPSGGVRAPCRDALATAWGVPPKEGEAEYFPVRMSATAVPPHGILLALERKDDEEWSAIMVPPELVEMLAEAFSTYSMAASRSPSPKKGGGDE